MNEEKEKSRFYRVISYMGIVYKDKTRKRLTKIIIEFLAASIRAKSFATHYFTSFLYKKDIENYRDYLSQKEMRRPQAVLCDRNAIDILHNKLLFQLYFEQAKIPLPRLIAYNFHETLFFAEDSGHRISDLATPDMMHEAIRRMLAKSTIDSIFIKPISSSCGLGVRKISGASSKLKDNFITELSRYISSGSFLFQDEIIQHNVLSNINASSLNTIRIDTFKQTGKPPELISACLRVGRAGSLVDNISSGGMYIGINLENGSLREKARGNLHKGGAVHLSHPGSGVVFKGVVIPFFAESMQLALEAASLLPAAMVGWDIAISSQGAVLLEGNAVYYGVQTSEVPYGGYRKNPVYQKILAAYKNKST